MSHERRVLITGANKGIGLATVAAVLEAAEDTVVWLGSRSAERGRAAMEQLAAEHPGWRQRIHVIELDVSSDASVTAAAAHVAETHGPQDALYGIVNNAGIGLGAEGLATVLEVNTRGPQRVIEAFLPMLRADGGRIVNVSSAAGPNFVARCSAERQRALTHGDVTWADVDALMAECLEIAQQGGDFAAGGLGNGEAYGLSKACLNAATIDLARRYPALVVNACTPGFIETDLTRPYAERSGRSPKDMGMKTPQEGTRASMHLLFGDVGGSGWYFGSDAQRSPLDRYRSPGDPPYTGD